MTRALALLLALLVCLTSGAVAGAPSPPPPGPWAEEDWRPGMATELSTWTVRGFALLDGAPAEDRVLREARMIHRAREWLVCDRLADGEPVATRLFYPEWYAIDGLQMDCSLQGQLLPLVRDGETHPTREDAPETGSTASGSQWMASRRQRMSPYGCALARAIAQVDSPTSDHSIDLARELSRVLQLEADAVEVVDPPRVIRRSREGPSSEMTIAGALRVARPQEAYPGLRGEWQSNDGVQFVAGMLTARRQGRLHLSGWLLAQFTGRVDGRSAIAWTLHEVTVAPLRDTLAAEAFGARPREGLSAPAEPWARVGSAGGQPGRSCYPFVLSPDAILLPASAVTEGAAVALVAPGGAGQTLSPRAREDLPGLRCFASTGAARGPSPTPSRGWQPERLADGTLLLARAPGLEGDLPRVLWLRCGSWEGPDGTPRTRILHPGTAFDGTAVWRLEDAAGRVGGWCSGAPLIALRSSTGAREAPRALELPAAAERLLMIEGSRLLSVPRELVPAPWASSLPWPGAGTTGPAPATVTGLPAARRALLSGDLARAAREVAALQEASPVYAALCAGVSGVLGRLRHLAVESGLDRRILVTWQVDAALFGSRDAGALAELAESALELAQPEASERLIAALLTADPRSIRAGALLVRALDARGDVAALARMRQDRPRLVEAPAVATRLSVALERYGDNREAAAALLCIPSEGRTRDVWGRLAALLLGEGDSDGALRAADEWVRVAPNAGDAPALRAWVLASIDRWSDALQEIKAARQRLPADPSLLSMHVRVAAQLGATPEELSGLLAELATVDPVLADGLRAELGAVRWPSTADK